MPPLWTLLASVCLVLALIAFLQYHFHTTRHRHKVGGGRILIFGPRRSGKTVLWHQLTSPDMTKIPETITSTKPNTGVFVPYHEALSAEEVQQLFGVCTVVDYPGHVFAQDELLEEEVPKATAFIFVLDSTDKEKFRESAAFLFSVLASPSYQKRRRPLCVLINKQWMPDAKHRSLIRSDLEREVERSKRQYGQEVSEAKMPSIQQTWLRRLKGYRRIVPKLRQIRLTKEANAMFRLDTLDCPLCVCVQGENVTDNLKQVKGFIQRAMLLRS